MAALSDPNSGRWATLTRRRRCNTPTSARPPRAARTTASARPIAEPTNNVPGARVAFDIDDSALLEPFVVPPHIGRDVGPLASALGRGVPATPTGSRSGIGG